jgi:polyhydroxybutyrate depolymerase
VFIIHGGLGTAQGMIPITGFNTQSDKSGFIAVYPNGSGRLDDQFLTWNGGQCCGYAQQQNVDDVGFFRQLIKDLATIITVDPKRIYATGLSNGAIMSYRLACELADQIAAIAPVASTQNIDACQPGQPVSVIHFHGTADTHAPYDGGVGSKSLTTLNHAPVKDTIAFWAKQNGCPAQPVREHSEHIIHDSYAPCQQSTAIELYAIESGGYAWPGGEAWWEGADQPTQEISATALIWEFFAAHPNP